MPANMKKAGMEYQKGGSFLKRLFGGKKKKDKSWETMQLERRLKNIRFDGTSRTGNQVRNQTRGAIKMRNDMYGLNPNSKRKPQKKYHREETNPIRHKKYKVVKNKIDFDLQDGGPVYTEKGMKVPGMRKAQRGFEGPGGGFMSRLRNEGIGSAVKGSFPSRVAGVIGDEYGALGKRAVSGVKNMMTPTGPSAKDGMLGNTTDAQMNQMSAKRYGGSKKMYKKGGGFPDMNKDGQITQADIFLKKKQKGTIKKHGGSKKYKSGGAVGPHGIL
jgi:hypothetical protein